MRRLFPADMSHTVMPSADRRSRAVLRLRPSMATLAIAVAILANCSSAVLTPEGAAEGALRATLQAAVAPQGFRSGVLPPELAEAWRSRAAADLGAWFGEDLRLAHLGGIETVTANLMEQPGPIVTSVMVQRVQAPAATIVGDVATIDQASIWYASHYAPGTWTEPWVDGVTMCRFELRRVDARWLVEEETCDVSGG